MRTRFFIVFSALLALLVLNTGIAQAAGTSYHKAELSHPAVDNWNTGFNIYLGLDENACRKAYGNSWPQNCASPALGEVGSLASGIEITPSVPGQWRWVGTESVHFQPQKPLRPDTRYQISLKKMPRSPRVQLTRELLVYQTQPQAIGFEEPKLWIDPSPKAAHAVSLPIRFIWPVNPLDIEKRMAVTLEGNATGLSLGNPRFVWNEDHTAAVVNVPILSPAPQDCQAALSIQNMPSYYLKDGFRIVSSINTTRPKMNFLVKGTARLMEVTQVELLKERDKDLNSRYVLQCKTSLRVKPSELKAALNVVQLPEKHDPAARKTAWERMPAISINDKNAGQSLPLELLTPDTATDLVRFAVPVKEDRCIAVYIAKVRSEGGLLSPSTKLYVRRAEPFTAHVGFLQPGNLLALGGETKLDLCVNGIDTLEWTVKRVRDPFLALLARTSGFTLEQPNDETGLNFDALSESVSGQIAIQNTENGKANFAVLDLSPLFTGKTGNGLMLVQLTGSLKGEKKASCSRLVLASDMGLTIKSASDGTTAVFVQNLSTNQPMSGVHVKMLGANGTAILEATSDSSGLARLKSMTGLRGEKKPVAIVASTASARGGTDLAWISLSEYSRELDMSGLATGGRHCEANGLLASVFSQRGLYMPGETLHFGAIIRRFDWKPLPAGLPLQAKLTSPSGTAVLKKKLNPDADGLIALNWKSSPDCATGTYQLDISLLGKEADETTVLGSTAVRIEEFEPDSLAMQAKLSAAPKGWIRTGDTLSAEVNITTLYGDAASGNTVRASFQTQPARLAFPSYSDYTFCDLTAPVSESSEKTLPEVATDTQGRAVIPLPLTSFTGSFRGTVQLEGFEAAGGRAVTRQLEAMYSPLEMIVGYKPQGEAGALDYLQKGSKASVRVIALNNNLDPISVPHISVTTSHRRYVNSLVTDTTGKYRYEATPVDLPIDKKQSKIDAQGTEFALDTTAPGDYLLTINGRNGETIASIPYTVAGAALLAPEEGDASSLAKADLRLKLSKEQFQPGETLSFQVTAPYEGTGLVTIEREKVVAHSWFQAKAGESVQQITIPKDFEGKGYLSVSFVRSAKSDNIYLSPHVYATAPFTSGMERRDMKLSIAVPDSILPGTTVKARISSQVPGRAFVFAVDEGVLSLTGFKTPDPLKDLLADRALDVVTRQAFDLLMPDHARLKGRIPAFGGDMSNLGGRFLNPFRRRAEPPFALWQGIIQTNPSGTEISIPVPEYLAGKIRIMAVGSSATGSMLTAGKAQASATVRGTIVLRPFLPLVAAPGDSFTAAVSVANTIKGSGKGLKVHLNIAPDAGLGITGARQHDLSIDEGTERTVSFTVKAKDLLGASGINFTAIAATGQEKASVRRQTLSIRPLTNKLRVEKAGALTKTTEIELGRNLYPFEAKNSLSISPAPYASFRALVARLDEYPFGCTEQVISRAFPYVAALRNSKLANLLLVDPKTDPRQRARQGDERIQKALATIEQCMEWNGVSLWPNTFSKVDFVTAYAADFLLTLSENGRIVPSNFSALFSALEEIVTRDPVSLHDARTKCYAAWLLLRSGELTQGVEKLEKWLNNYEPNWKKDICAVFLADCKNMMRLPREANNLMPSYLSFDKYDDDMFTPGVAQALFVAISNRSPWMSKNTEQGEDLYHVAFSTRATTVEMGLASRAFASMAVNLPAAKAVELSCLERANGFSPQESFSPDGLVLNSPSCVRFKASVNGDIPPLYWHTASEGWERNVPVQPRAEGMEITRRYLNKHGQPVKNARIGDILTVELTVRAHKEVKNAVLIDLLPGGLEPILEQAHGDSETLIRFERREDRALFFVNLDSHAKSVSYRVRAVSSGTFQIPQCSIEAMYAPHLNASSGGGTMSVSK